jgi:hypothetical protein
MVQSKSMKFLTLFIFETSDFKCSEFLKFACPNSALKYIPVQLVNIFFFLYLWFTGTSVVLDFGNYLIFLQSLSSIFFSTQAKNGIQEMECCSLESDWIYFHPDASGRIIHVGPNQVKWVISLALQNYK